MQKAAPDDRRGFCLDKQGVVVHPTLHQSLRRLHLHLERGLAHAIRLDADKTGLGARVDDRAVSGIGGRVMLQAGLALANRGRPADEDRLREVKRMAPRHKIVAIDEIGEHPGRGGRRIVPGQNGRDNQSGNGKEYQAK
jgi:hypothetical protein